MIPNLIFFGFNPPNSDANDNSDLSTSLSHGVTKSPFLSAFGSLEESLAKNIRRNFHVA